MRFDDRQLAFVVQGPILRGSQASASPCPTALCLAGIRRNFPGAEIILSTWRGSDVHGLVFDVLVENEDPGPLAYAVASGANANFNRMLASSRNGIASATRKYVVKTRTDILFSNNALAGWLERFTRRSADLVAFQERVVVPTVFSVQPRRGIENRLYHLSDWLQAGLRGDIETLWSCPPAAEISESDSGQAFPASSGRLSLTRYSNEQYLWLHVARRVVSDLKLEHAWDHESIKLQQFEQFVANEVVLLEPRQLGIRNLHYKLGLTAELNNFTHGEWRRLYRKYCDPTASNRPDFRGCFRQATADLNAASHGRLMGAIARIGRTAKSVVRRFR